MVQEGADIIDIGGESTRPGAKRISFYEEVDRVVPVIEKIKESFDVLVSVDTCKSEVARLAIAEAGADIVNDISALRFSAQMADVVCREKVPLIMMHMKGTPEDMQRNPTYKDVVAEIKDYFRERLDYALSKGINKEKIIIDPGIGFGKTVSHNIEILRNLEALSEFERPLMIGVSRKSFLGHISSEAVPEEREVETIASNMFALLKGVSIIRVHNVKNAVKLIKVFKQLA
jgi:dihydropteroate synthase